MGFWAGILAFELLTFWVVGSILFAVEILILVLPSTEAFQGQSDEEGKASRGAIREHADSR
jgi:hypothetical protein